MGSGVPFSRSTGYSAVQGRFRRAIDGTAILPFESKRLAGIALALFCLISLLWGTVTQAQTFQWPLAPFTTTPIVTQDYACRGTANLIAGSVNDVCVSATKYHTGIDIIPVGSDTTVYAAAGGTINSVVSTCVQGDVHCNSGFGNWVIIDHGGGVYSLYAHLQQASVLVGVGNSVTQGQAIAAMGATGDAFGAHLHFEISNHADAGQYGYSTAPPNVFGYRDPWESIEGITPTPVKVVNVAGLNVRRGPGTNYSVFNEVSYNQEFVTVAKGGNWYRVHLPCNNGTPCYGWIDGTANYSVIDSASTQVQVINTGTIGLNVRSSPGGAATLDKVFDGQSFVVSRSSQPGTNCTKYWYSVYLPLSSNATTGWMCGDYLSVINGGQAPSGQENSWVSIGPYGGAVTTMVINPTDSSTLYAGTLIGGVYKSIDGGATWMANSDLRGQAVYTVAIDPSNPTTLYAGMNAGGGVYKSTDGGSSWSTTNGGSGLNGFIHTLAIDPLSPATIYAGTEYGGVFKSIDGGASWKAMNDGLTNQTVDVLAIDPSNPTILYAGTGDGVYKSSDGGASWSVANNGLTNQTVDALAIDPSNPATLYAGTGGGVFKSTDGGTTWVSANNGLPNNQSVYTEPPRISWRQFGLS